MLKVEVPSFYGPVLDKRYNRFLVQLDCTLVLQKAKRTSNRWCSSSNVQQSGANLNDARNGFDENLLHLMVLLEIQRLEAELRKERMVPVVNEGALATCACSKGI